MRNFTLRKLAIVAIAVFTVSITANGQEKGDIGIGGNLVYGTAGSGTVTNYGIGGRFLYNITNPIRLDGSFQYFLEAENTTMWTFAVKGHYLFPVGDNMSYYPLAGVGIMSLKNDFESISEPSFILGGGVNLKLTDKISLNVEPNLWLFKGESDKAEDITYRLMISAGVIFKL